VTIGVRRAACALAVSGALAAACGRSPIPAPSAHLVERKHPAMGTEIALTAWTSDDSRTEAAFAAVFGEFDRLDAMMSVWTDGRFDVTFDLASSRTQWRYTGTAFETVEAAIATRALGRGDVIKQGDVIIERRPRGEFSAEQPARAGAVIGLAARGSVRAGQALRNADLMKPEVVKKNEMVLLHYEVPGIVLTMRGQALESGTEGDLVNVLNIQSKRTIQGVITGTGRVTIPSSPTARVAASDTQMSER